MKKILIIVLLTIILTGCSKNADGMQDTSYQSPLDEQEGITEEIGEEKSYHQINIDTSKFNISRFENRYIISNESATLSDGTIIFIDNQDYISNDTVKTQSKIYEYKENGENILLYSFIDVAILRIFVDMDDVIYCSVRYGNYDLENEYAFVKIVDGELEILINEDIEVIYASKHYFNYIIDPDFGDRSIYRYDTQTNMIQKVKDAYIEFSENGTENGGDKVYCYTYANIVNPEEMTIFELDNRPIVIESLDGRYQLVSPESKRIYYLMDKYSNQIVSFIMDKRVFENSTNSEQEFDIRNIETFTIINNIMYIIYFERDGRIGIYNCEENGTNMTKVGGTEEKIDVLKDIVVINKKVYFLYNHVTEAGNEWFLYQLNTLDNSLELISEGVVANEFAYLIISYIGNDFNVYNINYEYYRDTEETFTIKESLFSSTIEP